MHASRIAAIGVLISASFSAPVATAQGGGSPGGLLPPAGLVAWYEPFGYAGKTVDPAAIRMTPFGSDGVASGGVEVGVGLVGTCFDFSKGGVVTAPNTPEAWVTEFTLEGWVYWDASVNPLRNYIASQGDPFSGNGWAVMSNGLGDWHIHFNSSPIFPNPPLRLPNKQWTHIAVTYDPTQSNALRFHQNVLNQPFGVPSTAKFRVHYVSNQPLMIGRSTDPQQFFGGKLDELTLYDRPLPDADIQAIFLAGAAGKPKPPVNMGFGLSYAFRWWQNVVISAQTTHVTQVSWLVVPTRPVGLPWIVNGNRVQNFGQLPSGDYMIHALGMNDHSQAMLPFQVHVETAPTIDRWTTGLVSIARRIKI